ncbi:MAG: hypothetical protein ACU826_11840 [Gammaproteobacteria bacterium]
MPNLGRPDEKPRTGRLYNGLSALSAFLLWGGWAYYVNETSVAGTGLMSGLTQGTASFVITLIMVRLVTWFYRLFKSPYPKLILPALITVGITGSGLTAVHLWMGTPRIFYTVAPALSVALGFCLFTSHRLSRTRI